jgi:Pyruvate/2-oxoacid:ferredoxin oxidoreductase gamma subunit
VGIGGENGQGIASTGDILARIFAGMGDEQAKALVAELL